MAVKILFLLLAMASGTENSYLFDLKLDVESGELEGKVQVNYVNDSDQALSEIRFRLDMNLNVKDSLEILCVKDQEGEDLKTRFLPYEYSKRLSSDKAQMAVLLPEPLEKGASKTIEISYKLTSKMALNSRLAMMQDDPYFSFDAWYPKAMSFRGEEWRIDDDRMADYDVSLNLSSKMAIASTGKILVKKEVGDGFVQLRLKAKGQRGFAIYGSENWKVHNRKSDDMELRCLLVEDKAEWALPIMIAVEEAIEFYYAEYGKFPCDHLDIICPVAERGGGAFTACNVMGIFLTPRIKDQVHWLTAHEAAHQYMGCSIAQPRDQIGWITVGLGMVMDKECLLQLGHDDRFHLNMMNMYPTVKKQGRNTSLSQSVKGLINGEHPWSMQWNLALVHGKAYCVCLLLKDLLGDAGFARMMRKLIREKAGGMITSSELIKRCEKEYKKDLAWFVADWIEGDAELDYGIKEVKKIEKGWEVTVEQKGTASFPVLVEAKTVSGKILRQRVKRGEKVCQLVFEVQGLLESVEAAPKHLYPDLDRSDNQWAPSK